MRSYRNRRGGKRRTEHNRSVLTIFLIIIFTIAVVIGTVILGKYLGEKSEHSRELRESDEISSFMGETDRVDKPEKSELLTNSAPKGIQSQYFSVASLNGDHDALTSAVSEFSENVAITMILRDESGRLNYASSAAAAIGAIGSESLLTASELISPYKEKNCYISVIVSIAAAREDEIENSALRAFEKAMINEIVTAGADEVILSYRSLSNGSLSEIETFADELHTSTLGTAKLGVILSADLFDGDESAAVCRSLAEHFEVLALDMTEIDEINADTLTSKIQVFLERYNARVISDITATVSDDAALNRTARISHTELIGEINDIDSEKETKATGTASDK